MLTRARPVVLVAVTVLGLLGAGSPAAAGPAAPAARSSAAVARQPDLDWAGSQIAKHEPDDATDDDPTAGPAGAAPAGVPGLDVSGYQGAIDWVAVAGHGARFAYVKATEGTDYANPYFAGQYGGAAAAGLIRGAYHFATPDTSGGAAQADYFLAHGGGWTADGQTLPGMLDLEWNPYGSSCYGLTTSGMVVWIRDFAAEYHTRTGRWPLIYTATTWWTTCTGERADLSSTDPLALARYAPHPGPMPHDWTHQTIWQHASTGVFPGDQDLFNGDITALAALAADKADSMKPMLTCDSGFSGAGDRHHDNRHSGSGVPARVERGDGDRVDIAGRVDLKTLVYRLP